ncbi:MAG: hypothetical protein WBZ01_21495 [Terriglobales bacterium]
MPSVGTLTVNLEANTARFTGDLGKAAKSAEDFGRAATEAGGQVDYSMREARGTTALLGEELGVHIPRHLQTLIAEIPAVGAAFAEMLPIVGVVAAIAIIGKLIEKNAEAREKFGHDWAAAGVEVQDVFNSFSEKLLDAGIKADELAGNHLAALQKELQKIDNQSMKELASAFNTVAKAADHVFEDLKSHWYELGGSEEAKKNLDEFKDKYDALLAVGNKAGASDLLANTLKSATAELSKDLAMQGSIYGVSEKRLKSEEEYVARLQDAVKLEQMSAQVASAEKGNANTEAAQKAKKAADEALKVAQKNAQEIAHAFDDLDKGIMAGAEKANKAWAEGFEKQMGWQAKADQDAKKASEEKQEGYDEVLRAAVKAAEEEYKVATEKEKHLLAIHKQTLEQTAADEVTANQRMVSTEEAALNARIAALDKFAPNYEKKEKELMDKIREIDQQGYAQQQQIQDAAQVKELSSLQQAENRMGEMIASTAAKAILTGKNVAQNFEKVGAEMLESALTHALEMETIDGRIRLSKARTAAAEVYSTVAAWPVVGPFLAPELAAGAFASVMAFADGGLVPGSGFGDSVPAMLSPGETVVSAALTEQVKGSSGSGGGGGGKGHTVHVHTTVNAVDAENFGKLLNKHAAVVAAHVTGQLRRMNKG